jgi:hypothetical protein
LLIVNQEFGVKPVNLP